MKTKEQKVETYISIREAKTRMNINIDNGWFIHTCVSYSDNSMLVIYERNLKHWN